MSTGNITIAEDLRRKLEELARPEEKTPDDLANEAVARYVKSRNAKDTLHALAAAGQEASRCLGLKPSDVNRLIAESRREMRGRAK
jgi:predicted transcriptional regulator